MENNVPKTNHQTRLARGKLSLISKMRSLMKKVRLGNPTGLRPSSGGTIPGSRKLRFKEL